MNKKRRIKKNYITALFLTIFLIFAADARAVENGKIAFVIDNNIWTMNADGGERIQVASSGDYPKFSPNGTRIAYYRGDEVWVANANGEGERLVTYAGPLGRFRIRGLTWSPDGNRIAFTCAPGICAVNADGVQRTTISSDVRDNAPDWSPDGEKFVFVKRRFACAAPETPETHECFPDIYVMKVNGDIQGPLVLRGTFEYVYDPVWSPDGTKIAFGDAFFDCGGISVMDADGGNRRLVLWGDDFGGIPAYDPSWSPDGTKIAFAGDVIPGDQVMTDIFAANIDGTGIENLTRTDSVSERHPDWGAVPSTPTPTPTPTPTLTPTPTPTPSPTPNTLPGSNINVQASAGDASVTFSFVSQAGTTVFTPIGQPSSVGVPPAGYTIINTPPAYDITTSAAYTTPVTVCFIVSSINDPAAFARLRILHAEGEQLVDRTILAPDSPAPDFGTRFICAQVNSLSTFVAALAPASAATVTVSGRVLTPSGQGIRNAVVSLIDSQGVRRTATTSSFGNFIFENVGTGETYVIAVSSKRYRFASRNLTVNDSLTNVDFMGLE